MKERNLEEEAELFVEHEKYNIIAKNSQHFCDRSISDNKTSERARRAFHHMPKYLRRHT